jgi:DNA-binding protein H-NS
LAPQGANFLSIIFYADKIKRVQNDALSFSASGVIRPMATYRTLLSQKAALDKKIAQARKREIAAVVKQINALIEQYGLTPQELRFPRRSTATEDAAVSAKPAARKKAKTAASTVAPKYRNPETGDTWSGRGRAPKWVVGDKDDYLIKD